MSDNEGAAADNVAEGSGPVAMETNETNDSAGDTHIENSAAIDNTASDVAESKDSSSSGNDEGASEEPASAVTLTPTDAAVTMDQENNDDDEEENGNATKDTLREKNEASDDEMADDSDDEPLHKPKRKKKTNESFIDEEAELGTDDDGDNDDDSDDGEDSAVEGLIDDTEMESSVTREKKRIRIEDDENELADEDLKLIEENTGISLKSKAKRKRLKVSEDDSSDEDEESGKAKETSKPLSAVFDDEEPQNERGKSSNIEMMDDRDELDDFIDDDDDDEGQKIKKAKRTQRHHLTEAEEDAREIFGTFDITQLLQDDDDLDALDDFEGIETVKQASVVVHDPHKLEANFMTEEDNFIKVTDCPERIQYQFGKFMHRYVPSEVDCREEAEWIFEQCYKEKRISRLEDPILNQVFQWSTNPADKRNADSLLRSIERIVQLIRWEEGDSRPEDSGHFAVDNTSGPREVPFIAQYRKDYVQFPQVVNIHDLWYIKQCDDRYHKLTVRKSSMKKVLLKVKMYQQLMIRNINSTIQKIIEVVPDTSNFELQRHCKESIFGCKLFSENNEQFFDWLIESARVNSAGVPIAQSDGATDDPEELSTEMDANSVDDKATNDIPVTDPLNEAELGNEAMLDKDRPTITEATFTVEMEETVKADVESKADLSVNTADARDEVEKAETDNETEETRNDFQIDSADQSARVGETNSMEADVSVTADNAEASELATDQSNEVQRINVTDGTLESEVTQPIAIQSNEEMEAMEAENGVESDSHKSVNRANESESSNDHSEASSVLEEADKMNVEHGSTKSDIEKVTSEQRNEEMQQEIREHADVDATDDINTLLHQDNGHEADERAMKPPYFCVPCKQTIFSDVVRVKLDRTLKDSLAKLVDDTDLQLLDAAATEDDLDVMRDYMALHFGDALSEVKVYEEQLLTWCGETVGRSLDDFHRSWYDGEAFLGLVQQAADEADRAAGRGGEYHEEYQERSPIVRFEKGVSVARHKLDLELGIKPVELLRCKNRHCMLIPEGVTDLELENGTTVRLCTCCRPDEAILMSAVDKIRTKMDSIRKTGKSTEVSIRPKHKKASKKDRYSLCRKAGLLRMVDQFGLTAEEFADNLMLGFSQHELRQPHRPIVELAANYISLVLPTEGRVLDMAKYCIAMQLARDPAVYHYIRNFYVNEGLEITVRPTPSGERTIEDWHPYARYRYLTKKPVHELKNDDFAWLMRAKEAKLLKLEFSFSGKENLVCELEKAAGIDTPDESNELSKLWKEVVNMVVSHLLPRLQQGVHVQLKQEAENYVTEQCANHLRSLINRAPFQSDEATNEEESEVGTRICAIMVGDLQMKTPTEIALLHAAGDVADFLRLDFLTVRETSRNINELQRRSRDWAELKRFLSDHVPQLIVIGAENMDCQRFLRQVQDLASFPDDDDISPIPVEFGDTQLPLLFANSKRSLLEFPEYTTRLRQAVSLGRTFQSIEIEFAACLNEENEILSYKWHPLQDMIPQSQLLDGLSQELITTINRVGVDINQVLIHKHIECSLSFVCSFGFRKAASLLDKVRVDGRGRVYSRKHFCSYSDAIGAAVAWVSCGFLYMDIDFAGDDTEIEDHNILDTTRIHPEMYIYAGTIARDALEHLPTEADQESNKTENISQFLDDIREVMQNSSEKPEQLDALLMNDYALEVEKRTGKSLLWTLKDIQKELAHPFKDTRLEFRRLTPVQLFTALTQETIQIPLTRQRSGRDMIPQQQIFEHIGTVSDFPEQLFREYVETAPSLMINQIVHCRVTRLAYKPNDMNPTEPPKSTGCSVAVKDSSLRGFVPLRDLTTDRSVQDAAERVEPDMEIFCRIRDIQIDRFSLTLGSKSTIMKGDSDAGRDWDFTPAGWGWDEFYDGVASREAAAAKESKQIAKQGKYQRRAIDHPAFKEVTFGQANKYLADKPMGDVIVRPSSKGIDHLTISFKLTGKAVVHVDVREEGKNPNERAKIGDVLYIRDEKFESLDEIIDSYISSIVAYAKQLTRHKNFRKVQLASKEQKGAVVEALAKERKANPKRIPYCIWYREKEPQSFMLSCFTSKAYHEFISVKPDGFKFCNEQFTSIIEVLSWFKKNYMNYTRQRSLRAAEPGHGRDVEPRPFPPQHYGAPGGYPNHPPPGHTTGSFGGRMMAR